MKICELAPTCPGCSLWGTPYSDQIFEKVKRLEELFQSHLTSDTIHTHTAGEYELRERFDFIIKENQIGLVDKERNFIPIKRCLQLAPQLQHAFDLLTQTKFNIRIGTIRLRVSSHNQIKKYGLWLDFANNDIKNLLIEKTILQKLSKDFFIEVGQKKKCLDEKSFDKEQIKLADPKMQHWFHTYNYKTNASLNLNCAVSSFTQPSAATAKLMTDIIAGWMMGQSQKVWEFGCGIGQYTFPLLSLGHKVSVFENDEFALESIERTANENNLRENLTINAGDFQRPQTIINNNPDAVLVNPPKSGLKSFTHNVIAANPKRIIYVSCYPESLRADSEIFLQNNFKITKTHIVDQFPQTKHFEVVMLFERVDI